MNQADLLQTRRMTPEDVLAYLVDDHQQQVEYDPEADAEAVLTFDTTVAEWRHACDLVRCSKLGQAMNIRFGTDFSREQWLSVLTPENRQTLRAVCELVASAALVPVIRPQRVHGKECQTAGAFLLVRDLLARHGVDVSDLKPSSPLAPYTRDYPEFFLVELAKIAPGKLPPVRIVKHGYDLSFKLLLAGIAILFGAGLVSAATRFLAGRATDSPWLGIISVVLMAFGYGGLWVFSKRRPDAVQFGTLMTFGDLCRVLVSNSPAGDVGGLRQPPASDR